MKMSNILKDPGTNKTSITRNVLSHDIAKRNVAESVFLHMRGFVGFCAHNDRPTKVAQNTKTNKIV